jgi:xanthine dehydrogenase YagS FAD-binding subunit
MRSFSYHVAQNASDATAAAQNPDAAFLAGGTTLVDLMKLDVMTPAVLVDLNPLQQQYGQITAGPTGLHLGALVRMADAASHPDVLRDYPVIAQSLQQAASPQLRNMASLGGNVLQRTRCSYFRDPSWTACNKRNPGSGCAAMTGTNRRNAVLGTSDQCIATYAGDFANALLALGSTVNIVGPKGPRSLPFDQLHRLPGETPNLEHTLAQGEMIAGYDIPAGPWTKRSLYLKIRDRESYDFALASAAVAIALQNGVVQEARVALGGVATKPWRSVEAENALKSKPLNAQTAEAAATLAFAAAKTHGENAYKPDLGRRTLVRALLQAAKMEA